MFYAAFARYGIITAYGPCHRPAIYVFPTKRERDAWVSADVWDGDFHREAMTAREAANGFARIRVLRGAPAICANIIKSTERRPAMGKDSGSTIITLLLLPFVVLFAFVSALFGLAGKTK